MNYQTVAVPLFIDAAPPEGSIEAEVVRGLSGAPRTLPPKLFYDREGSRLFDAICELPEYYPTRTETAIMEGSGSDMARALGPDVLLIEYGSGSSTKTEILLSALQRPAGYVPIDISRGHLLESAERIARRHPGLRVLPVCADYSRAIPGLSRLAGEHRSVVYFPGSTVGNFEPNDAAAFLAHVAKLVGPGGGLLIGVDLRKAPDILEAAYNDSEGVTAAFNLNMLRHINVQLGPVFDVDGFRHRAVWNDRAGRIEMHLVSERTQTVRVGGRPFGFEPGDAIVTEHSYKYTLEGFGALAGHAGFRTENVWTDPKEWFSVHYLTAR